MKQLEFTTLLLIIPKLLFYLFLLFLCIYFAIARSNAEIEKGKTPIFAIWCYGAKDGLRKSGIRLAIYNDFIVISRWGKDIILAKEIEKIERGRYLWAKCVSIHWHSDNENKSIFLYPRKIDRFIKVLEKVSGKKVIG